MPGTGARTLRADAQRNHDAIVAVATQAFLERGTSTSLDDIARRAGVGAGTLYRRFPSRESLVAATLDRAVEARATEAEKPEGAAPGTALTRWFFESAQHLRTYDGLPDLMAEAAVDPGSPLHAHCVRFAAVTETLLRRAQRAGAVRADVDPADLGALVGSIAWASARRHDADESLRRLLSLATEGLLPR